MSTRTRILGQFDGQWRSGGHFKSTVAIYAKKYRVTVDPSLKSWEKTKAQIQALGLAHTHLIVVKEPRGTKIKNSKYMQFCSETGCAKKLWSKKDKQAKAMRIPLPRQNPPRRLFGGLEAVVREQRARDLAHRNGVPVQNYNMRNAVAEAHPGEQRVDWAGHAVRPAQPPRPAAQEIEIEPFTFEDDPA